MTKLIEKLGSLGVSYKLDEPMKNHTSFKTGGNAALFIEPENEKTLSQVLKLCNESAVDVFVLGKGSNLLVSDDGIKNKAVIHISKGLDSIELIDDDTIRVGAGASLISLCKFALANSLTGLEFAYGIPGSCGGAAFMNAGAYGGEMKDVLISCTHLDKFGNKGSFSLNELDLSYRHSVYSDKALVITSLTLKLEKGNKTEIENKMNELMSRRKEKQPLEYPSAGSVFKRPEGYFAGALIEQSNLKGKRIGGAAVSEKHAGFIINVDNATTSDVLNLIEHCRQTVKNNFGVELEPEIRLV